MSLHNRLGVAFAVLLSTCWACSRPVESPRAVVSVVAVGGHEQAAADLRDKTIGLLARDEDNFGRLRCAGVWVSERAILTSSHCVEDWPSQYVEYATYDDVYDPQSFRPNKTMRARLAQIWAADPPHDLALLFALHDTPGHRTARVVMDSVASGSFVHTMGHPAQFWWSYSSGNVAGLWNRNVNGERALWIQATCPISPGSSGGGLFDENNNLVGITHGSFQGQNLNVFVHSQYLDAFLRRTGLY